MPSNRLIEQASSSHTTTNSSPLSPLDEDNIDNDHKNSDNIINILKPTTTTSQPPSTNNNSISNGTLSFTSTILLVIVATLAYSMHGVLTELCKKSNGGKLTFNTSALVMVSEVLKLLVSFSLLYHSILTTSSSSSNSPTHHDGSMHDDILSDFHKSNSDDQQQHLVVALLKKLIFPIDWGMVIPAFIYGINNPISFLALNYMDAATFQALSNLKIITTTLLSWIVFRKGFTPVHWASISLLFIGCLLTTENPTSAASSNSPTNSPTGGTSLGSSFFGLVLMIVSAVFSALAGVAFEFYAKKQKNESLHAQNFRLYLYGIVFNVFGMLVQYVYNAGAFSSSSSSSSGASKEEWFIQFTFWTICVLLNQSFSGLLLSAIMRFTDNIVRLYCIAAATVLSTLFAVMVLGLTLHKLWIYAAVLITISIYLYNVTLFHSNLTITFGSSSELVGDSHHHHHHEKAVFYSLTATDLKKIAKSIVLVTAVTVIVVYSSKF